jgi:hypothetical protein
LPILLFLLFLITSCSPTAKWHLETPNSLFSKGRWGRLYLLPKDCYAGISLEIIRSEGTEWCYINSYTLGFTEDTPPLILTIDGISYPFEGKRLEGFQRVLMPPDAAQLLITALLDGHSIDLTAGNYQILLHPLNFGRNYVKLKRCNHTPPFVNN